MGVGLQLDVRWQDYVRWRQFGDWMNKKGRWMRAWSQEVEIPAEPPSTYQIVTPGTTILYNRSWDHKRIKLHSVDGWCDTNLNLGDFYEYVFLYVENNWMLERKIGRSRERRLKQTPQPKDWESVACLPLLLRPHQVPVLGSETPHPYNKFPSLLKLVGTRFLLLTRNRVLTYTRTCTQSC